MTTLPGSEDHGSNQPTQFAEELARLSSKLAAVEERLASVAAQSFVPMPPFPEPVPSSPFMPYSTCSVVDFMHPRYLEICALMKHPFTWHRKLWEWVFVIHHLLESGVVAPGSRGVVFGVGAERLPAVFARFGAKILATDAPAQIAESMGWKATGQYASALSQLRYLDVVDAATFDANVGFQLCDMNAIPAEFVDFDFNWSSCCFEHLGSLEAGMQFVENAVERTLRPGGVAVHTTEFNLSSNETTVEEGETVIYRLRDILELVQRLRDRGHTVDAIRIAPAAHYWDFHVDVPPFSHIPHLKLLLQKHVATSIGIVVRKAA